MKPPSARDLSKVGTCRPPGPGIKVDPAPLDGEHEGPLTPQEKSVERQEKQHRQYAEGKLSRAKPGARHFRGLNVGRDTKPATSSGPAVRLKVVKNTLLGLAVRAYHERPKPAGRPTAIAFSYEAGRPARSCLQDSQGEPEILHQGGFGDGKLSTPRGSRPFSAYRRDSCAPRWGHLHASAQIRGTAHRAPQNFAYLMALEEENEGGPAGRVTHDCDLCAIWCKVCRSLS